MIYLAILTFVFVIFAFCFLYFWGINPGDMTVFFAAGEGLTFPTPIILIGAILIGLLLGNGLHILSLIAHSFSHWRRDQSQKKAQETNAIYREGVVRLLSGDLKKARVLLKKAMDRDPKRVDTLIAIANLAAQEGNSTESLGLLRKAGDLDPKSLEVLFKTAAIQEETGHDDDAMASYQELISREKDNRKALRSLRYLYLKHSRWQDALEIQRQVLKAGPGASRVADEKALLLYLRYEVASQSISNGSPDQAK